jgi:hypothetical protein
MIWITYIFIDALFNWYLIERRKTVPNYVQLTLVRGIAAILYGAFILDVQEGQLLQWFLLTACSFWILFDILINLFRGKYIFYIGTNSKIDQFGIRFPLLYWLLKLICLTLLILILI